MSQAGCKTCSGPLSDKNTTGYCKHCIAGHLARDPEFQRKRLAGIYAKHGTVPVSDPNCSGCGKELYAKNSRKSTATGLCKACFNRHPEHRRRRGASVSSAIRQRIKTDAEYADRLREIGRALGNSGLGNLASPAGSEPRRRVGQTNSDRARSWCPQGYWEHYQFLLRSKGLREPEAKRQTLELAARERSSDLAARKIDGAIFHLRRLAPVYPKGDGYQYGTVILSPEQLVDRALQKGWQP